MFDERLAVQQKEAMHLYGELGMTAAMPVPEQLASAVTPPKAASSEVPAAATPPAAEQPSASEQRLVPGAAAGEQVSMPDDEMPASNEQHFSEGLRSQLGYR